MSRQTKFYLIGGLLFLIALVFYFMPGRESVTYQLGVLAMLVLNFLRSLVVGLLGLFLAVVIGYFAHLGFDKLDKKDKPNEQADATTRNITFVLGGIVVAIVWILIAPWFVNWSFLAAFGREFIGFTGIFETPPIWWGVWGFLAYWFGWSQHS